VCLSILNTWGDNEWSPCQTLTAILSTIQSIMNKNPIVNEPNYENEKETGIIAQNYNKIIEYYNIRGAVLGYFNLNNINNSNQQNETTNNSYYSNFTGIIKEKIKENYEKYYKNMMKNMIYDGERVICNTYSMNVLLDYTKLKNDITFFLKK
jgi:hypothetical protein